MGKTLVCPRGHSFDVARSGYVNLLQPQDRRSKAPGDSREAVQARRRLALAGAGHERWMVAPIVEALDSVSKRTKADPPAVLDLGCGEGYLLGSLASERKIDGFGVDISVPAIELAAKTYPGVTWLVANADRRLPLPDAAFDFVMSVTARRNGAELARLLSRGGRALVVVPGSDDLAELREAVLGRAENRDRTTSAIEELAPHLELVSRRSLRRKTRYAANDVRDLLAATYRGGRTRERERAEEIGELEITSSRELLLFRLPRPRLRRAAASDTMAPPPDLVRRG